MDNEEEVQVGHTPEPWRFGVKDYTPWGAIQEIESADGHIADVVCAEGNMADANLLLAAPSLLAALAPIADWAGTSVPAEGWDGVTWYVLLTIPQLRAIVAAVAKARGEINPDRIPEIPASPTTPDVVTHNDEF